MGATQHFPIPLCHSRPDRESSRLFHPPLSCWRSPDTIGTTKHLVVGMYNYPLPCDKIPFTFTSTFSYHIPTTWRSPDCERRRRFWLCNSFRTLGCKVREGAVKSVVRIHPLALKHACACSRHRNTWSLKNRNRHRNVVLSPLRANGTLNLELGFYFEFRISCFV